MLEAKISTVIQNKHWNWAPARSEDLVSIQSRLPCVSFEDIDRAICFFKESEI